MLERIGELEKLLEQTHVDAERKHSEQNERHDSFVKDLRGQCNRILRQKTVPMKNLPKLIQEAKDLSDHAREKYKMKEGTLAKEHFSHLEEVKRSHQIEIDNIESKYSHWLGQRDNVRSALFFSCFFVLLHTPYSPQTLKKHKIIKTKNLKYLAVSLYLYVYKQPFHSRVQEEN